MTHRNPRRTEKSQGFSRGGGPGANTEATHGYWSQHLAKEIKDAVHSLEHIKVKDLMGSH
jgi:hypothetical protein